MSIDFTQIHHFAPDEFQKPDLLRWDMLKKLDGLREQCGFGLVVTSSFRALDHNANVGGVKDSAHCPAPDGFYSGIDLSTGRLTSWQLYKLITAAIGLGFERIGIYPKHIHLDIEDRLPHPVMWVGKD